MHKKIMKKQLLIFLLFSFGLVWIPTIAFALSGGKYEGPLMNLILSYSMLCPAIAVLITRKLTKEGLPVVGENSLQLGIDLKNKKWIWYLFAFLAPSIYSELGYVLMMLVFPETYNPAGFDVLGIPRVSLVLVTISGWVTAVIASIGALGEEIGWRTYLYPKLEKMMGPVGSILAGGTIWGIWHFPANTMGHNYGTGYWGEPWTGYIVFTVMCIAMGAMLYLVTKKTGSVWPAAIMHAVNNSGNYPLALCCDMEKLSGIWEEPTMQMLFTGIPQIIMGIIAVVMICKMTKTEKSVENS